MDNSFDLKFMSDEELQNARTSSSIALRMMLQRMKKRTTVLNQLSCSRCSSAPAALKYITRVLMLKFPINEYAVKRWEASVLREKCWLLTNQSGLREWQSLQTTWRFIHWLRTESV